MWCFRAFFQGFTKNEFFGKKLCSARILATSIFMVSMLLNTNMGVADGKMSLKDLYSRSKGGTLLEPAIQELEQAQKLFSKVLRGDRSASLVDEWAQIGMRLIRADDNERGFTVLTEDDNHKYGRGFFVFDDKPAKPIGLFAPHRFTDEMTGTIAFSMALENPFTVVGWSTVKRRDGGRPPDYWDLGKLRHSYFVALTKAFAQAYPSGYHVQIHGYETEKRKTAAADQSDAIISAGTKQPRSEIFRMRDCLREKGFGRILVYPSDVRELGATKNISGIVLREMGNQGFVHVEINFALRQRLEEDRNARRAFADCLWRELR